MRVAAAVLLALCLIGCVRFSRVEYSYPANNLDATSGVRLKRGPVNADLGSGVRYDGSKEDPLVLFGGGYRQDNVSIGGHIETTIPDFHWSGFAGMEVEW